MSTAKLITPAELDRVLRYPRGRSVRLARKGLIPAITLPDGELRFSDSTLTALLRDTPPIEFSAEQGGEDGKH